MDVIYSMCHPETMETRAPQAEEGRVTDPLPIGVWLSVPVVAAVLVFSLLVPGFFVRALMVSVVAGVIIACLRWTYAEENDEAGQ